jgi:RNA polymerase sigma factor (sigma-70 family)
MLTEHAFGEFFQRHARAVWTYVYRSTNDAADADDIVQEAFLRLLQTDIVPADGEGLRRYVFRIAGSSSHVNARCCGSHTSRAAAMPISPNRFVSVVAA